jgi:peptidoglycan/xylan/chitin deacetylase (PgdA/CDA1 family)
MKPFVVVLIPVLALGREVAITIDDLPRGGDDSSCNAASLLAMTEKLMKPFRQGHLPVTGFVIGSRCPDVQRQALRIWLDTGAELGNHTFSHPELNETPVSEYIADIVRGEAAISDLTGVKPRYFRYPYLRAGKDPESYQAVIDFLGSHGYRNAPVTLDNSDYMFARIYARALLARDSALASKTAATYLGYMETIFEFFEKRSVEVTGHEVRQTLLIHASQLNADVMPQLLTMIQGRGYKVVTLDRALEDEAYRLPERVIVTGGFSWIHRWARAAGKRFTTSEPDEPKWVTDSWNR